MPPRFALHQFPNGTFEKNNPHQIYLDLDSARGMPVWRGNVYQWDVPLHINHRTAPYERGVYGRLFHKVVVTLNWAGWSGWWKGGRSLVAEQLIFLASASRNHGVLSYARTLHGHARELGPVLFHVRTRHLSVGGYLRIAFALPHAAPHLDLHALQATMIQRTTLHSRQETARMEQCTPERIPFFKVTGEEFDSALSRTHVGDHATIEGQWITRLPHDALARPTSLSGSEAAIRHEHSLELKVVFRRDGELLAYTTRWPVVIPACGMLWRSVKLPSYSESDPSPVPEWKRDDWEPEKYPNHHLSQTVCACGQSLEKLLTWEQEGDAEQNTVTTEMLRESIRAASIGAERASRGSRSRSRNRSAATSRSVSRRPSLDVLQLEEDFSNEGDEIIADGSDAEIDSAEAVVRAAEEQQQRRRQKAAQLYRPDPGSEA